MAAARNKDGDYKLPNEQKYYLSINGELDKSFKGDEKQCDRQAKKYRDRGDSVTYVPIEEVE
jgi:hypothetical protein